MANLKNPTPHLKLNDGNSIPMLGFGVGTAWYKSGDASKIDQGCIDAVKTAIGVGYTHLDGAEVYKTEKELGIGVKESKVDRSKLFITTKAMEGIKDLEATLKKSLKELQLDYVDLYLIHYPFFTEKPEELQEKWKVMESLKAQGLAKSIGVSNYRVADLKAVLETATVKPAINQIEFQPYLQRTDLIAFHREHGIATAAYGPLGAITKGSPGPVDDVLAKLAKKYAVSENEICLRWCIDQDVVPVTTSGKEQRMSDYMRSAAFKLTPAEIQAINEEGKKKYFRGFFSNKFSEND
ncbi:MAG: hypothetical protein M1822_010088 [Bathelium mastoideum]|nr:MAG: hypothetical protein M1822_010088 [Bathelium mastoideum]